MAFDPILTGSYNEWLRKPVLSKVDFVRRYKAGEFGNHSPTWDTVDEWLEDRPWIKYGEKYHIRNRVAGGPTWYDVQYQSLPHIWNRVVAQGNRSELLYVSAMAPTEKTLIQGEVQEGIWGLDLFYTTVRKPMRDALQEKSFQVSGVIAVSLLHHYLNAQSYDWLLYLLEAYPDHVIEFSCYDICWGTVDGFNTVYWEVRKY